MTFLLLIKHTQRLCPLSLKQTRLPRTIHISHEPYHTIPYQPSHQLSNGRPKAERTKNGYFDQYHVRPKDEDEYRTWGVRTQETRPRGGREESPSYTFGSLTKSMREGVLGFQNFKINAPRMKMLLIMLPRGAGCDAAAAKSNSAAAMRRNR